MPGFLRVLPHDTMTRQLRPCASHIKQNIFNLFIFILVVVAKLAATSGISIGLVYEVDPNLW